MPFLCNGRALCCRYSDGCLHTDNSIVFDKAAAFTFEVNLVSAKLIKHGVDGLLKVTLKRTFQRGHEIGRPEISVVIMKTVGSLGMFHELITISRYVKKITKYESDNFWIF